MFDVSNPLDGVLVVIVSGGRPRVGQRPTEKFLPSLPTRPVMVVSSHEAEEYEPGAADLVVYDRGWAREYAEARWVSMSPPGDVLGSFPGREFACRLAEERGCWAVIQLDDNVELLGIIRGSAGGFASAKALGGLGFFAEVLALVSRSTNAVMCGAQLQAVAGSDRPVIARPGFPYSIFLERVGAGREEWFGPMEDDIMHAFAYGTRAEWGTSAVVPVLRYKKEHQSQTGNRAIYDSTRSVRLQQLRPESASIGWRNSHANGQGQGRVFHRMGRGAIRNPLIVTDPKVFAHAKAKVTGAVELFNQMERDGNREKLKRRGCRG